MCIKSIFQTFLSQIAIVVKLLRNTFNFKGKFFHDINKIENYFSSTLPKMLSVKS